MLPADALTLADYTLSQMVSTRIRVMNGRRARLSQRHSVGELSGDKFL